MDVSSIWFQLVKPLKMMIDVASVGRLAASLPLQPSDLENDGQQQQSAKRVDEMS